MLHPPLFIGALSNLLVVLQLYSARTMIARTLYIIKISGIIYELWSFAFFLNFSFSFSFFMIIYVIIYINSFPIKLSKLRLFTFCQNYKNCFKL